MEDWQIAASLLVSVGALLTPIVLAARARDTALLTMIQEAKSDMRKTVQAETNPLHERVNRVRDEFVRRDDLDGHLARLDKRFDDINHQMQRNSDTVERRLDELLKLVQRRPQPGPAE